MAKVKDILNNVKEKIKPFFKRVSKSCNNGISYVKSKFNKTKSEEEIKELYKNENNIYILKKYEDTVKDTRLKKKITKRIEDLEIKRKEEKETIIDDKEYSRVEKGINEFNKNIAEIDKKIIQIRESYKNESTP